MTSVWNGQHPNAGQNIKHTTSCSCNLFIETHMQRKKERKRETKKNKQLFWKNNKEDFSIASATTMVGFELHAKMKEGKREVWNIR